MIAITSQRRLDAMWAALAVVVLLQVACLCVGLYACGWRVSIGAVNLSVPRQLTAEQAAAMEDRAEAGR